MSGLALRMIRFYQMALSPLKPVSCRFTPTCSQYGYEAVVRYGLVRGGWMVLKRLVRCHPFSPCEYDPVP